MNRSWTPESHVSFTDAGMVIEIQMKGVKPFGRRFTYEENYFCYRGEHEEFGPFEVSFEIPSGYNIGKLTIKTDTKKGICRIEIPPGKKTSWLDEFPKSMLIYCDSCGKHFDIVITGKGPADYTCPACGKVQVFDLDALVKQVTAQSKNFTGKTRKRI